MTIVLVVDDDPNLLKVIVQVLTLDGHEILTACDGLEALEVLRYQTVDLMVLDLQMPNLDGRGTVMEARRNGFDGRVLILSSFGARAAAKELDADGAIAKPFDPEDLSYEVNSLCAQREEDHIR